jgi:riboflavin synthase alpha subunit
MLVSVEREEREWQYACQMLSAKSLVWALVKLLVKKGVVTVDEVRDTVMSEAGGHAR